MNIITIIQDTIREAISRKVIIFFFAISSLVIIGFFSFISLSSVEGMIATANLSGDKYALKKLIKGFQLFIIGPLYAGGLFLSIFTVSSFIPNMLEKGTIDLLLSKPISRLELLLGKFFGGTIVIFVNVAYLIIAIWLMISLKFGIYNFEFLYTITLITFIFMVLYVLIMLIGVLTQSSILAMILSYLIFFILSPILSAKGQITTSLITSEVGKAIITFLYYIVPQTSELGSITMGLAAGQSVQSWTPVLTTGLWGIVIFTCTVYIFQRKSY